MIPGPDGMLQKTTLGWGRQAGPALSGGMTASPKTKKMLLPCGSPGCCVIARTSRWPRKTHRDGQDAESGGSLSAMLAVVDAPCDAKASKIGGRGAAGGMPRMAVRAAERNRAGWNSRAGAAIR